MISALDTGCVALQFPTHSQLRPTHAPLQAATMHTFPHAQDLGMGGSVPRADSRPASTEWRMGFTGGSSCKTPPPCFCSSRMCMLPTIIRCMGCYRRGVSGGHQWQGRLESDIVLQNTLERQGYQGVFCCDTHACALADAHWQTHTPGHTTLRNAKRS